MLTIPSGANYAQCSVVLVPVTPNGDSLQQPWVLHYLLFTSTVPTGASYAQQSLVFSFDSKRQNLTTSFSSARFAAGEVSSPVLDVLPAGDQCSSMSIIAPALSWHLAKLNSRAYRALFLRVCVCVFSSHPFWTSSSLDVPAGVTQEEGHTGFLIHLPFAVRALIFVARRIQPFLSLVDREVGILCTNELIVLHPLGIFILFF